MMRAGTTMAVIRYAERRSRSRRSVGRSETSGSSAEVTAAGRENSRAAMEMAIDQ